MKIRWTAAAGISVFLLTLSGTVFCGCGDSRIAAPETGAGKAGSAEAKGAENETASAETEQSAVYAPMSEIKQSVEDLLGENYWPDRQLTEEELETETNITKEMYEEYLAEEMKEKTDIDRMIILRAKKNRIAELESLLNEYRDNLMVLYKDRPQELGKVEASRIEIIGNYVCFVQLGADTSAAAEGGDEEVLALCQQENERAIDVIEKTILE